MATNSTSFTNTPQAVDDNYRYTEDYLLTSGLMSGNRIILDVMSDDLGGKAKSLFSIDDGNGNTVAPTDLLRADGVVNGVSAWETTANGNLIRINNGKIEFDASHSLAASGGLNGLSEGQTLSDSFVYAIQMGNGTLSWATVSISIVGQNDGPVANNSSAAVKENATVTAAFAADDADSDDNQASLHYTVVQGPTQGNVTVNANGTYTFDASAFDGLAQGETTNVTFTYKATDSHGADSEIKTVTVTVTGINDGPVANNSTVAVQEDATVTAAFPADDVDSDDNQASLHYTIVQGPAQGSVVVNSNGTFTFDASTMDGLAQGETANVTFTYKATDSHGADSEIKTVTVTVTGINDGPVANNSAVAVNEDSTVTAAFAADDVDSDDNQASLHYAIVNGPAQGSVAINSNGTFTFDAAAFDNLAQGETTNVSFTYKATDSHGAESDVKTVTVTVTGINDGPVAHDSVTAVNEDATVTAAFAADDVDSDDNQASLHYNIVQGPAQGSVAVNSDGTFTFDASTMDGLAQGETANVTFTYKAIDSHGAESDVKTVTVTVTGVNDGPTADNSAVAVNEDATVTAAFAADDIDSDDNQASLHYAIVNGPAQGSVAVNANGTFTFDAGAFDSLAQGETTDVTFTYKATDSHGAESDVRTVTVTVTGTNDGPVAHDSAAAVSEDATVTAAFAADDIDSDDNQASLAYTVIAGPTQGSVSVNGDGTYTFDAAAFDNLAQGETSDVSFTYKATDSHGAESDVKTVTVTVTGVNDGPVANDSAAAVAENATVTTAFAADDVDSDDNQASLHYSIVQGPAQGSVAINSNGTFTFDAAAFDSLAQGETTDVSFTYKATDSHGADSDVKTVTVTVTGVNDGPVAHDSAAAVNEDATVTAAFAADDVDSDDNQASLAYSIVNGPGQGSVAVNGDGTYTFDAGALDGLAQGEQTDVTFTYQATDSHGADSDVKTVTVTVTGVNDGPVANDSNTAVSEDATVTTAFAADDVDSDDNQASLNYVIVDAPTQGSVAVNGDGTFTFDAGAFDSLAQGEQTNVSFTYKATDAHGAESDVKTVTVTVTGVNDGPDAHDSSTAVNEDATVTAAFAADDVDSDDNQASLSYVIVDAPAQGSVTVNGDGTFTFDAAALDSLADGVTTDVTFTYKAIDSHGAESGVQTVTVTVTGVNDDPTISSAPTTATLTESDSSLSTSGTIAFSDVDNGDTPEASLAGSVVSATGITLTLAQQSAITNAFTVDAAGHWSFNLASPDYLAAGDEVTAVFTVNVADDLGANVSQDVTIKISGSNDAPVITSGSNGSVNENAPASTIVYAAAASDIDSGDSVSWSLGGIDAGAFSIDSSGNVRLNSSANFEAKSSYSIDVIASDGALSATKTVSIGVIDVNEAPSITSGVSGSVNENAPANTVVYAAAASDPDAGDSVAWSLSGTDASAFNIDSSGNVRLNSSANFETKSSYSINVIATDNGLLTATKAVTVSVNDVNEAPTITSASTGSVNENAPTSTIVYSAAATDPDAGSTISWSLGGTDASAFNIDSSGNVRLNSSADFETKASYSITVIATDNGLLTASKAITISVNDVVENHAPVATDDHWFVSDATAATFSAATAILANDSDPDGNTIKVTALSNDGVNWVTDASDGTVDNVIQLDTTRGLLSVNSVTGAIAYTTDNQSAGDVTDTFYYRITDNNASPLSDDGMVTVTVKDIANGNGVDTVNLSGENYQVSYISSGGGGDNLTGGNGLDTFLGGPADDILVGGNGNDTIFGDSGNDTITGSAGNDTLTGSGGNDTFVYTSKLDGNDVLTDFTASGGGQDTINLDALFDNYGTMSGTRASHVSIVQSGSDTLVLIDTNNSFTVGNNATYEMTITLTGITSSTVTVGSDVLVGS